MDSEVNDFFQRVLVEKENHQIFNETLEIVRLREYVIEMLTRIEETDSGFWWTDNDLMEMFDSLYTSGCIILPRDPVERLRWIALLCIEISEIEGFDCGNIVLPPDFLPEAMFGIYEDVYGVGVIEEIKKIRERLAKQGWEATFAR